METNLKGLDYFDNIIIVNTSGIERKKQYDFV